MSTTNKSHKLLAYFVASLLALTGMTANAAEAQPPGLLESFLCNFNDGQDMDDLLSARDYYLRQAEKAGITPEPAYVWTLFKGDLDFELIWHNVHANLAAFGNLKRVAVARRTNLEPTKLLWRRGSDGPGSRQA